MTLRTRFLVCFLLPLVFGLAYMVNWLSQDLRQRYLESMEEALVDTATVLASLVSESYLIHDTQRPDIHPDFKAAIESTRTRKFEAKIYDLLKTEVNLRIYITDTSGIVIYDSNEGKDEGLNYIHWNDVKRTLKGEYGARATKINDEYESISSTLYVAAPILTNGVIRGVLTVCKPTENTMTMMHIAKLKLTRTGLLAALTVFLIGVLMTAWITRPIQLLSEYSKAIHEGRQAEFPRLNNDEIGALGKTMQQMQASLKDKTYVENYVQELTHEVKGPLASIQGAAELLHENMSEERKQQFLGNIENASHRIRDIIDRLLELASLESRTGLKDIEELSLQTLCQETIQQLRPQIEAKKINIRFDPNTPTATCQGERFLLNQCIANILQNALHFTPSEGSIEVTITQENKNLKLAITDSGPGIPDYAISRIFERFYSTPPPGSTQKSSGLGLTMVQEAVALHGGRVQIANTENRGACAELILPIKQPESATNK